MAVIFTANGDEVLVDDADYAHLSKYKWHLSGHVNNLYVCCWSPVSKTSLKMHRIIMGLARGDGLVIDHINGNRLDNRKENLRICSRGENSRNQALSRGNTSGFKGVTWHKYAGKFFVQITCAGKRRNLGYFDCPELGHEFYCLAADMLHGEFANHGVNKK